MKLTKKVLLVTGKFILGGSIAMTFMILFQSRQDLLMSIISLIISFLLGGIIMFLSVFKDLKRLVKRNKFLKRKLIRMKKQMIEYEKENKYLSDAVAPEKLFDVLQESK